jgi:hypothetical protein
LIQESLTLEKSSIAVDGTQSKKAENCKGCLSVSCRGSFNVEDGGNKETSWAAVMPPTSPINIAKGCEDDATG